jgi:hypothetical protein
MNTLSKAATNCLFLAQEVKKPPPCKTHSDLDIAIKMDTAIPRKTLFNIEEDFEESNLNYQVDLLDLHRISDSFSRNILHKLVPISPPNKTENLPP